MKIYTNIIPLLEVMHYYNRRTNGSSASDTMFRLEHAYIDRKDEIHPLIGSIVQLEALFNSALLPNIDRLDFFFKQLDGIVYNDTIDLLPASLLLLDAFYRRFDSTDEVKSYLSGKSIEYVRGKICTTLSNDEGRSHAPMCLEELVEFIDAQPLPDNTKWRIMDLCRHFRDYADELMEFLRPAIELTERNSALFEPLVENYARALANSPDIPAHVRSIIGMDISEYANVEIYPSVLGFNSAIVVMPEMPGDPLRIYMGVMMHIVGPQKLNVDVAEIARSMKSLGDPSRLEMLCCIRDRSTYGQDLSSRFGVSSTTVYHHMNKLMLAGIVESKLNGNRIYFTMNRRHVSELIDQLRTLLLGSN